MQRVAKRDWGYSLVCPPLTSSLTDQVLEQKKKHQTTCAWRAASRQRHKEVQIRVIVQCVVSLLFLATQCTQGAIVQCETRR